MTRPLVLVAWEPKLPEEALAVQEPLAPLSRVEWIHELSPSLAPELLQETVAIIAGDWPAVLNEHVPSMTQLRLVSCVYAFPETLPVDRLRAMGVRIESGLAPPASGGPEEAEARVLWARDAAQRVVAFLSSAARM